MKKLWKNIKRWKYQILIVIGLLYFGSRIYRHKNILASEKTDKTADIEDVVKKALEELKKHQLIPVNEEHEKNITEVLKEAAQTEAKLTTKMAHMIENKTMREIEKEMSSIIGHERVDLIKNSFAIETYRMKVVKKPDGQSAVHVHRRGVEFQPKRMLKTIFDINKSKELQWASLVVELFFFVHSCVAIIGDLTVVALQVIVRSVEAIVKESTFMTALNKLLDAWNAEGGSAWGMAKAIFYFLKDTYLLDIFWKIFNSIFQHMSTPKEIRVIGEVALIIVAAFATNGLALIVRIVLALNNAVYLKEKIENLVTFSNMTKPMK